MPIDPHLLSEHMDEIAAYLGEQQGEFGKNLANALDAARGYSAPKNFESFASKIEQQRGELLMARADYHRAADNELAGSAAAGELYRAGRRRLADRS